MACYQQCGTLFADYQRHVVTGDFYSIAFSLLLAVHNLKLMTYGFQAYGLLGVFSFMTTVHEQRDSSISRCSINLEANGPSDDHWR